MQSTTVGSSAMQGAKNGSSAIEAVGKASADIDTVNIFAKLVKKAEDAAQAGT